MSGKVIVYTEMKRFEKPLTTELARAQHNAASLFAYVEIILYKWTDDVSPDNDEYFSDLRITDWGEETAKVTKVFLTRAIRLNEEADKIRAAMKWFDEECEAMQAEVQ
jgi:hypothetical protein